MNLIKFLRDVVIWISENYQSMHPDFKRRFPKETFINARTYLYDVCDNDSEVNQDFSDYE